MRSTGPNPDAVHALRLAVREAVEIAKKEAGVYTAALETELASVSGRCTQTETLLKQANLRVAELSATSSKQAEELRSTLVRCLSMLFTSMHKESLFLDVIVPVKVHLRCCSG